MSKVNVNYFDLAKKLTLEERMALADSLVDQQGKLVNFKSVRAFAHILRGTTDKPDSSKPIAQPHFQRKG